MSRICSLNRSDIRKREDDYTDVWSLSRGNRFFLALDDGFSLG